MDLNALYRKLLDSGRRESQPPDQATSAGARGACEPAARGGHDVAGDRRDVCQWTFRPRRPASRAMASPPSTDGRPGAAWADRSEAGGTESPDGPLRPHDRPRRAEGRHALEPGRPQRRRRRHSPADRARRGAVGRRRGRADQLRRFLDFVADEPLPGRLGLPRHDRLPAGRVPRPELERPRPRRVPRRSSPGR